MIEESGALSELIVSKFESKLKDTVCPKLEWQESRPLNPENDEWQTIFERNPDDPKPELVIVKSQSGFKVDVMISRFVRSYRRGEEYDVGELVLGRIFESHHLFRVRTALRNDGSGQDMGPISSEHCNHYVKLANNLRRESELRSFLVADPLVILTPPNLSRIDLLNTYHEEDIHVKHGVFLQK